MSVVFNDGSGHTATISRNPSLPLDWYPERFNQVAVETADAGKAVYDNGPTVFYGTLIFRGVTRAEGDALRTWLITYAIFEKTSFSITPPSNTNLGNGDGVAMAVANYNGGKNLSGVFQLTAGGLYDINFSYRATS